MGRKLDLTGLTDVEAEHVMQVVQRDMELRKTEETRLNEMKKALVEEGSRSVLLSRQHRFNERCCIRCCSPFTFLLNPKRSCLDCCYNVCKGCCTYSKKDKGWLCSACQKTRLLKTESLEWFYNNVRRRFKRFGSAKVLKNLYRRHAAERGVLAELTATEGSTYEESGCNESSMYESDSTFYRQSEEHSMAETINVARRVAEEAIDEAIAKAESQTDSQEKQNEAHYLRENRKELIEELAKTIVQKIVRRKRDLSEMKSGCNLDQNSEGISPDQTQSAFDASLWRSRSAFCLLTDEKTGQHANIGSRLSSSTSHTLEMKKEEPMPVKAMPSWRSVDHLDNSILQSPDGNWIAYQSNLLSRPGLLTKRKSLVYSVLERESGVVLAYDEIGSETEPEANGVWGAALEELRRKMSANKQLSYPESYSRQATLPLNAQAQHLTAHNLNADTEDSAGQDGPLHQSQKTLLPFLKRKVPLEHRRPSSTRRPNIMDKNLNPGGAESSEDGLEESRVKRSRRRRKNKREEAEWKGQLVLSSDVPDSSSHLSDALVKRRYVKQDSGLHGKRPCDHDLEADTSDTATPDILSSGAMTPDPFELGLNAPSNSNHGALGIVGSLDQELTTKLKELTSQVRETQLSSTEDELDRLEYQMGNEESETKEKVGDAALTIEADSEERSDGIESTNQVRSTEMLKEDDLTSKLRELTSQVSETLLSSTEDQLDRCEYQTETKGINQSIRTEVLGVDDRTDGNKVIQYDKKTQNYVEMVEKAEEERSEKRQKDTVAKQGVSEQNDTGETQMSEEISSVSQKQTLDEADAQNEIVRERTEETKNKGEVQTEEKNAEIKDSGSALKGQQSRAENTETVDHIEEQEVLSCELALSRLISEDGKMEFDSIINTVVKALDDMEEHIEAYTSERVFLDREISEGEKHEMMEEEENITEQETDDNTISKGCFVGGKSKVVQEKEMKEEGKINEVVALKSNTEDTEETEDKQCSKSSEERVQVKDGNSQGDLTENSEKQRDPTIQHSTPSGQEEYLSPEEIYKDAHMLDIEKNLHLISNILQQKYSAASLRSITTEVLKVLNATEDLIHGSMGNGRCQLDHSDVSIIPPDEARRLDEQLGRLEENVYVAAGTVYGLEAELRDLEECARCIRGSTTEGELAHLEDQVASAAAQVLDISSRIAALKNAGLNVTPQTQFTKTQTIGSSRKLRRRLPAPPKQDERDGELSLI
ncbi:rab effector MyRIP isoform X3 [Sinocyclocheilus rhinocerous]|uniref:rab effector MyRIP isoform X3 n=1 Tax=Sinocyclocheilus rhinocerous TaxID=307959 RepID=UPI0007BA82A0|nr:PREDICTED: rab effector MyRIP-like isoform X3 [Sinocyclocheilus rhinocerous]